MNKGRIFELKGRRNSTQEGKILEHKDPSSPSTPADKNFQNYFARMPIALWELDLTGVHILLNHLGKAGIIDLRSHLSQQPEFLTRIMQAIRIREVNEAACRLYGAQNKAELIDSWQKIFLEESSDAVREILIALTEQKDYFEVELSNQTLQGQKIFVRLNLLMPPKDQTWEKVWVSIIDLSQQIKMEEELRNSEERHRLLVEQSDDGIMVVVNNQIVMANQAMLKLHDAKAEEMLGKSPLEFIHADDRPMAIERIRAILKGEPWTGESHYRALRSNGEMAWVNVRSKPINWSGQPAVQSVVRDETERKKAEQEKAKLEAQFYQAQKIESIGTLAGGIAHDFNNLLMGIQGNTSLVLLELDPSNPHYERLKNIEQNVQNGSDLTRQLLGFAQKGKYEVKPTNLNEKLIKSSQIFGRAKKEIRIHTKLQPDLWVVEADQGQMDQVLMNLYVNAWQAMPGGGELFLQTENVEIGEQKARFFATQPGRYIKISVSDTGVGMDEATMQKLFEPFFTTKKMGRGTGLGLASVYGIIKNHGGFIEVFSKEGAGSTFDIYLPASGKASVATRKAAAAAPRDTAAILFIDDEEMIVTIGKQMLSALGHKVETAGSGQEALAIYQSDPSRFDLVILDIVMPDIGGGATYDALKRINPQVKVLLSSGYSIDGEASEILKRGGKGFIQKPFDLNELALKIKEILSRTN
jgi:PAS domain S-box-containing protein